VLLLREVNKYRGDGLPYASAVACGRLHGPAGQLKG
jgi:hypothetical protein